eukprot:TRINITY_DN3756_c0_g1_i1.p1 TRINITY_DN3756_c0_g1~~TRINITY_DN3756_c0_g1_i1.p1  ORF type:complete len:213 (+),score=19.21 TRINITY_DN3756_c0_g1_i1:193-831(+)
MVHWFVVPLFGAGIDFIPERAIFAKERASKQYRVSSYFISRFTSSLPLGILNPIIFGTILYWCCNLNAKFERYIWYTMIAILTHLCGQSLGLVIASLVDSFGWASFFGEFILFTSTIVSGFYSRTEAVPVWFRWTKYIAPMRYIYDAFLVNEFEGEEFTGPEGIITGEQVIEASGVIFTDEIWASCLVIMGFTVAAQILAYIILYYNTRPQR